MAMTVEERRAYWREKARRQYAALSPERKEARLAKVRENGKRRYYTDLERSRADGRLKWAGRRENETWEQWVARSQRDRARYLQRRDTPEFREQLAASRARNAGRRRTYTDTDRERDRLRREARNERVRLARAVAAHAATRRYRRWTSDEDREVVRTDLPVLEIALNLGRTREAVVSRRRYLRKSNPSGDPR